MCSGSTLAHEETIAELTMVGGLGSSLAFLSRIIVAISLLAGAAAKSAIAQTPVQIPTVTYGSIKGVAFDSLLMLPIAGAQLQLVGTGVTATSDAKGRFEFDKVPTGPHQIVLSSTVLDSLGFGTIGTDATVVERKTAVVTVAPTSLRTIWQRSCYSGNIIGKDSGVVWGTVRDAATGRTSTNASVEFNWYDLRPGLLPGIVISDVRKSVTTNAEGVYFACGVPVHVAIGSTGMTDSAASGRIDFELGDRALQRLDLTVSVDMVVPDTAALRTADDSVGAERLHGTATVRGRVVNERNEPMRNALVGVVDTDSIVRTDNAGRFSLSELPGGTHNLNVRRVGQLPVMHTVQLRAGETAEVTVVMSSLPTLTTVNVRAEVSKSKLRQEYDQRRKSALGYAIDGKLIEKRADMYSIFRDNPHMTVSQEGFGLSIQIRTILRGRCYPQAFLDGFAVPMELASSLPTDLYRAVEVYENPHMVPAEYTARTAGGGLCGAILFWTKRISW